MKGNENTARRSHPNLPPYGKGLTVSREVSPIQANPHFKEFVPLVRKMSAHERADIEFERTKEATR